MPMDRDIAALAGTIAEPARAAMLMAMMDGTAYSASELARIARVKPPTASFHLAKLQDAHFVDSVRQGRHRYFRIASTEVADLLEALGRSAPPLKVRSLRHATMMEAMRAARTCYTHLAGRLGVGLADALVRSGALVERDGAYRWTPRLYEVARALDLELPDGRSSDRAVVRPCLDCSERRYHLAGTFAAGLARAFFERGWISRSTESRTVRITGRGRAALRELFQLEASAA